MERAARQNRLSFPPFWKGTSDMKTDQRETNPIIRISGDSNHPLMKALSDLYVHDRECLGGLIQVWPSDVYPISVMRLKTPYIPYRKALDEISQFLQDSGFEEASKAIDCHFEL